MRSLLFLAVIQGMLYGALAWLSGDFAYGTVEQERPLLVFLALIVSCFAVYIFSLIAALKCDDSARLAGLIVVVAIVLRAVLLPSHMIQELDLYRYLWDGAVVAEGGNPYRYAPKQVREPVATIHDSANLQQLFDLRGSSADLSEVLDRIHFAELPTCYPPVSQAVFALGDVLTPEDADIEQRVTILKSVLVLFDLATIVLLGILLRTIGRHRGWLIAYAWCPLVLKEFANSGHLDSIAVFFSLAAATCVVRLMLREKAKSNFWLLFGAILTTTLAIGAKLYPVVLLPVLVAAIAAKVSTRSAITYLSCSMVLAAICLAPMFLTKPAPPANLTAEMEHTTGLKAFLTEWEMNDFLFMLVYENIRPVAENSSRPDVWFAVVPNAWRQACIAPIARALGTNRKTAAFLVTRALTGCVFLIVAMAIARNIYRHGSAELLLEGVFLTLAWFWLLAPTQNPWYWTWALPFLPFARNRVWWAVSGLALLYYLRFYLRYHMGAQLIFATGYNGPQFFDFVLTWLEYGPWLVALGLTAYWQSREKPQSDSLR